MGKQTGSMVIGTYGNLNYYRSRGVFYLRKVSSLTGKRVKTDKRFGNTMKSAGLLAQASRIASGLYKELPINVRELSLFRHITGKAKLLLKKGKSVAEVQEILREMIVAELTSDSD